MEQHEIARAQDEAIRMYRDSLVSGSGIMGEGNAEDFIFLAKAAMKKTMTQLETVMARHLAIANPRNGPEFIKEVWNFMTLDSLSVSTVPQRMECCERFDTISWLSYPRYRILEAKKSVRSELCSDSIGRCVLCNSFFVLRIRGSKVSV